MEINEVERVFNAEFGTLSKKFSIIVSTAMELKDSEEEYVWHPGVYVWWSPRRGVVRVGRSLSNSRKRAMEHIPANTGGIIKGLAEEPDTKIILFNVKDPKDLHWVAALEIFLEGELSPCIPSERTG